MPSITVHGVWLSPPVRAVALVCEALGIEYSLKEVNLLAREHLEPEYIQMNPLHTIPTIQDGDFTLFESHAIVAYLADKYAADESWYPKDLKKRATVNTRLHINNSILFTRIRDTLEPVLFRGNTAYDPEGLKRLEDGLSQLDKLLGDNQWVAGETPTIADCCCASTASSIVCIFPSLVVPPRVSAWLERCEQTLPKYVTVNKRGAEEHGKLAQSKVSQAAV